MSKFNLSHQKLVTAKFGELVPVGCMEVLPGAVFNHSTKLLLRATPMMSPVMHPVTVRIHHWFVPNRLIWTLWESFITGGSDGLDASVPPTVATSTNQTTHALLDCLGVPPIAGINVSALPVRAYNKIWNEWYRDQDLQTVRGEDEVTLAPICWEKDRFTAARPWAQKGAEVTLPLGTSARIATDANADTDVAVWSTDVSGYRKLDADGMFVQRSGTDGVAADYLYADLTGATSASVSTIRRSFALQRYKELRAQFGSRYPEYIEATFGVRSRDARLQRPEYLGGGKQMISFSEVLQTAAAGTDPVGTMRGHGISFMRSRQYQRRFEEHGWVLSLMSIRPKTIYANGIPKKFLKTTKEDFFQPELQFIGQEEIKVNEVYASAANGNNVFGYGDRYGDYMYEPSQILGEFRGSLYDDWHLARMFGSQPSLNSSFVAATDATNRVFADQTGNDTFLVLASHALRAWQPVKKPDIGRII